MILGGFPREATLFFPGRVIGLKLQLPGSTPWKESLIETLPVGVSILDLGKISKTEIQSKSKVSGAPDMVPVSEPFGTKEQECPVGVEMKLIE
ncbi:hypothetical protein LPTSP1_14910 [Leptospira johnsonii]|uniref:Uncharacterized protein n=1 Tax=Leptospira johnsonii TaxID=1917820 RepID=A0A2P2D1I1_9LEPT|nr:hypothetical protein LPTSP1_14910 [Leptospira johnsonii]